MRQPVLALSLLGLLCWAAAVQAIEEPCSACEVIAAELQRRLEQEKPRNHLDLRHRLDEQGKRYGKVIEYKVSELRAVELLDDLCEEMRHYSLVQLPLSEEDKAQQRTKRRRQWVKVKGDGAPGLAEGVTRPDKAEEDARLLELGTFCGVLLERHEDAVMDALTSEAFAKGVAPVLCQAISSKCKGKIHDPAALHADEQNKGYAATHAAADEL